MVLGTVGFGHLTPTLPAAAAALPFEIPFRTPSLPLCTIAVAWQPLLLLQLEPNRNNDAIVVAPKASCAAALLWWL